jgi:hypothetical protein
LINHCSGLSKARSNESGIMEAVELLHGTAESQTKDEWLKGSSLYFMASRGFPSPIALGIIRTHSHRDNDVQWRFR